MRRHFCIIHNPSARRHAGRLFSATLKELRGADTSCEIVPTEHRGQGTQLASDAVRTAAYDAIVAAGGDGTIHDVAAGLLVSAVSLGTIPMGTGKVFALEPSVACAREKRAAQGEKDNGCSYGQQPECDNGRLQLHTSMGVVFMSDDCVMAGDFTDVGNLLRGHKLVVAEGIGIWRQSLAPPRHWICPIPQGFRDSCFLRNGETISLSSSNHGSQRDVHHRSRSLDRTA